MYLYKYHLIPNSSFCLKSSWSMIQHLTFSSSSLLSLARLSDCIKEVATKLCTCISPLSVPTIESPYPDYSVSPDNDHDNCWVDYQFDTILLFFLSALSLNRLRSHQTCCNKAPRLSLPMKHGHFNMSVVSMLDTYWTLTLARYLLIRVGRSSVRF